MVTPVAHREAVAHLRDHHGAGAGQVGDRGADHAAEEQAGQAADRAAAEHRRDGEEAEDHQREVLGRAELQGQLEELGRRVAPLGS